MLLDNLFLLQKDFDSAVKDIQAQYRKLVMVGLNYSSYIKNYTKEKVNDIIITLVQELALSTISELKKEYEKNSEKRVYTKILADNVLFLSPKGEGSVQATVQSTVVDQTYKAPSNNDSFGGGDVIPDESIPF
jgi:hypothetical protein